MCSVHKTLILMKAYEYYWYSVHFCSQKGAFKNKEICILFTVIRMCFKTTWVLLPSKE